MPNIMGKLLGGLIGGSLGSLAGFQVGREQGLSAQAKRDLMASGALSGALLGGIGGHYAEPALKKLLDRLPKKTLANEIDTTTKLLSPPREIPHEGSKIPHPSPEPPFTEPGIRMTSPGEGLGGPSASAVEQEFFNQAPTTPVEPLDYSWVDPADKARRVGRYWRLRLRRKLRNLGRRMGREAAQEPIIGATDEVAAAEGMSEAGAGTPPTHEPAAEPPVAGMGEVGQTPPPKPPEQLTGHASETTFTPTPASIGEEAPARVIVPTDASKLPPPRYVGEPIIERQLRYLGYQYPGHFSPERQRSIIEGLIQTGVPGIRYEDVVPPRYANEPFEDRLLRTLGWHSPGDLSPQERAHILGTGIYR